MITFDEFTAEHNNQFDPIPGTNTRPNEIPNQCVYNVNSYILECLNGVPEIHDNALKFFVDASTDYFDKVVNSPNNAPPKGAIVVMSASVNEPSVDPWGHVCLATGKNPDNNTFGSFSANWPLNAPCHFIDLPYTDIPGIDVIGWLIPKNIQPQPQGVIYTQDEQNALNVLAQAQKTYSQGNLEGTANFLVGQLTELNNTQQGLTNCQNETSQLTADKATLNQTIATLTQENADSGLKELEAEKALAAEQSAHKTDVMALQSQLTALQGHSGDLPAPVPIPQTNRFFAWLTHLFGTKSG